MYNSREYLKRCADSLKRQGNLDYELVFVDDGSTDGSLELAEELLGKDENVQIIHKSHSGIAETRYIGVKATNSEYVTFIDSDDWIEDDAYDKLIQIVDEYKLDMIAWSYVMEGDINPREIKHLYDDGLYAKDKIINVIVPNMMHDARINDRRFDPSLCCKIMRRDIYFEIANDDMGGVSLGEDAMISYPAIFICEKLFITNTSYYHYMIHDNSCVRSNVNQKYEELEKFNIKIRKIFENLGVSHMMSEQVDNYMRVFLEYLFSKQYGFHITPIRYHFPYELLERGMAIAVYGAGDVGESYVSDVIRSGIVSISVWVDKKYKEKRTCCGIAPMPVDSLSETKFDKIVIAIMNKNVADEIKRELTKSFPENQIIWEQPKRIM